MLLRNPMSCNANSVHRSGYEIKVCRLNGFYQKRDKFECVEKSTDIKYKTLAMDRKIESNGESPFVKVDKQNE